MSKAISQLKEPLAQHSRGVVFTGADGRGLLLTTEARSCNYRWTQMNTDG